MSDLTAKLPDCLSFVLEKLYRALDEDDDDDDNNVIIIIIIIIIIILIITTLTTGLLPWSGGEACVPQ